MSILDPVLGTVSIFEIRWYGLLMAVAFLAGYFMLRRLADEEGIKRDEIDSYFLYIFLGILIGARLGEVLFYGPWSYYLAEPWRIIAVWQGGLSSHGAFIGGILATMIFCRVHRMRFYRIADIAVIPIAFGSILVRIGNLINGEIVGRETSMPWGMVFENYDEKVRHPSQIYEAMMNFIVFALLLSIRKLKKIPEGFMFWSFVVIYSILRFFVEFFKEYQTLDSSSLFTMGQLLSIAFFAVALYVMVVKYKNFILAVSERMRKE
ncbi:prolipoprotein diacylglyceryl transferase [Candidatus Woesearchaeota archaeon]|nr:prolipoprotein diacylglyceryl transferase [Candidatus Woesearchaeota archaeon]